MKVLIRVWMKNRGVSFNQAMREVKARLTELANKSHLNPVAYLIELEKKSMLSNELEEFEAEFS